MSNLTDEMTQLRARLDRAAEDRRRFVAGLAHGEAERRAQSERDHAERARALAKISARVTALRSEVQAQRARNLADLEGARTAWQGTARPTPRAAPLRTGSTLRHDDLTSIQGIGPGIQERLNRAGIHTFAELAAAAPERLLEALGELKRLASVETWVAEALTRTEEAR